MTGDLLNFSRALSLSHCVYLFEGETTKELNKFSAFPFQDPFPGFRTLCLIILSWALEFLPLKFIQQTFIVCHSKFKYFSFCIKEKKKKECFIKNQKIIFLITIVIISPPPPLILLLVIKADGMGTKMTPWNISSDIFIWYSVNHLG